jgi:hypothetical protein
MADQTIRRRGLQQRDNRREAVADLNVANQFQQPVRSPEAPGTNLRSSLRTADLNRPPAQLPRTRLAGGNTGVQKDLTGALGGSTLGGQMRGGSVLGGQMRAKNDVSNGMRGGRLSRGSSIDDRRAAQEYLARQTLAERDPSSTVDPKTGQERRYGKHGLTFSELKEVYKYQLERDKTDFDQAQSVAEFHRDNAKTAAELDIARRERSTAEGRLNRDMTQDEFNRKKARYDAMTKAEQEAYDRGQTRLETRMDATEKDRRFGLDAQKQELAEKKFQVETLKDAMSQMSPEQRKVTNLVNEDNQEFFLALAENEGYANIYGRDGEVSKDGKQFIQTINTLAKSDPDRPTEWHIAVAAQNAGLITEEEKVVNDQIEMWVSDRENERTSDPKAWRKREEATLALASDIFNDISALEKGDKGRGLLGIDREKGIEATVRALKEKYNVIEASPKMVKRLPEGTLYIASPMGNQKYPRVLKSGSQESSAYASGQAIPKLEGDAETEAEARFKRGEMKVGDYFRDENGELFQIEQG